MSDYEDMMGRLDKLPRPPPPKAAADLRKAVQPRGERHGCAKFTNEQVKAVYDALEGKRVTPTAVAEELGISLSTVYNWWKGRTYKEVERNGNG